jgi:hypothetical protein
VPKLFCDGRLGQLAFEFGMTKEENSLQANPIGDGLVAFFDILGYKEMLLANTVEESLRIVNKCLLAALAETKKTNHPKIQIKTFVISDSILIALPNLTQIGVFFFTQFCSMFIFELLIHGLPARGAIATGRFSIKSKQNQIAFVGQPIIDAYELTNSLEIAACALTPASEGNVLPHLTNDQFQLHNTPVKNLPPCKLYLLKYGCGTGFSREKIIQHFKAHNKHIDAIAFNKLNNTIEFLKECGELQPIKLPI